VNRLIRITTLGVDRDNYYNAFGQLV